MSLEDQPYGTRLYEESPSELFQTDDRLLEVQSVVEKLNGRVSVQ